MPIPVSCEMCFAEWSAPDRAAGKRVTCPDCGEPAAVPAAHAATGSRPGGEPDGSPPPRRGAKPSSGKRPPSRAGSSDTDGGGPKPRGKASGKTGKKRKRRRQRASSSPGVLALAGQFVMGIGVGRILVGVVLVGVIAGALLLGQGTAGPNREQKKFASTDVTDPLTTSEWFAKLKELRTEQNPTRRVLLKRKVDSPEMCIGPDPAALPVVFEALSDPHLQNVARAVLGKFTPSDRPYVVDLEAGLQHANADVRSWAIRLSKLRPDSAELVPRLVAFARGSDVLLATQALDALSVFGEVAVEPVSEALESPEPRIQIAAVQACGTLGAQAEPLVPRIAALAKHEDPGLRRSVAQTIAAIGPGARAAATPLAAAFQDEPDEKIREQQALALAALGPVGIEPLIAVAREGQPPAQLLAIQALGRQPAAAEQSVPVLVELLRGDSRDPHGACLGALRTLKELTSLSVADAATILERADMPLQLWAAAELGRHGTEAAAAAPLLQAALRDAQERKASLDRSIAEVEQPVTVTVYTRGRLDEEATEREKQRRADRSGEMKTERDDCQQLIEVLEAAIQKVGA